MQRRANIRQTVVRNVRQAVRRVDRWVDSTSKYVDAVLDMRVR